MAKPRPWPNKSRWARDDSAELFQEIVREARNLMREIDPQRAPVAFALAANILDHAQRGRSYLVAVGAEVRDDDL